MIGESLQKIINTYYSWKPQAEPAPSRFQNARLVAHRGHHADAQFIENTLPAFQACLESGIWGIELDLRWTRDHVPVVHHDPHTQRLFPNTAFTLSDLTRKDLRDKIPLIPDLEEVLSRMGRQIHLMIEIKSLLNFKQAEVLGQLLRDFQPKTHYHLLALDLALFDPLRRHFPVECFLPVAEFNVAATSEAALRLGYAGMAGHYSLIGKKQIDRHHQAGQFIGTGFSDSPNILKRELNRGVDWIFTDRALAIQSYIKSRLDPQMPER